MFGYMVRRREVLKIQKHNPDIVFQFMLFAFSAFYPHATNTISVYNPTMSHYGRKDTPCAMKDIFI